MSDASDVEWQKFTETYGGLIGLVVVDKSGKIITTRSEAFASEEDTKLVMESWLAEFAKPFVIQKGRFVPLKNDPLQFVSTNKTDNLSLVGSITKSGVYTLLLAGPDCTMGMLPLSIELNRWVWDKF